MPKYTLITGVMEQGPEGPEEKTYSAGPFPSRAAVKRCLDSFATPPNLLYQEIVELDPAPVIPRFIEDHYYKDYGTGQTFISGLPIPKDEDNICRDIHFHNCSFHPGCNISHEGCKFTACDGTPGPEVK